MIIGVDEVGLGALAGPLVVCAFAAPSLEWTLPGLDDSKKIAKLPRWALGKRLIKEYEAFYELVWVSAAEIDRMGMKHALPYATNAAAERLMERIGAPERILLDGADRGPCPVAGAERFVEADGLFSPVMAASVVAKVTRDEHMAFWAAEYPEYGFAEHSGYPTGAHRDAIHAHGICPIHRKSYGPIKARLEYERYMNGNV